MQTVTQILENQSLNTPYQTTSTGVSDDLVVLFEGRIFKQESLELAWSDIDIAMKTMKRCKLCAGVSECVMPAAGWQAFYDNEDSSLYGYVRPCFRYKQCQHWLVSQRKEATKPRYQKRTFDTFTITDGNKAAYDACRKYAESFHRMTTQGLLLIGPPGTGKTHLAVSIHRATLAKGIASVLVNMPNLVNELLQSFKSNEESMTYAAALEKRLVIIDDLGAERLRDWVSEHVYRLINERYEKMLPVIITTNCSMEILEERIGEPAIDRLSEMCKIVPVEERSWRRRVKHG